MVLSSAKSAKKTLKDDPLPGWGQIVKVSEKHDRFGLDYRHTSCNPSARGGKKFNPVRFSSTGYQFDPSIAVVDAASSNQHIVISFVRNYPPKFKLDNWTTIVVPVVFSEKI